MQSIHIPWKIILRALWVAIVIVGTFLFLYWVIPLIYPFVFGWLIAYLINPVVKFLQKKAKFPRWLGTTTGLLLFLGIISGFIALFASKIAIEIGKFAAVINDNLDNWRKEFISFIESDRIQNAINQISTFFEQNEDIQGTFTDNLNSAGKQITSKVSELITNTINILVQFLLSLPNMAVIILISLLAAFFISKDWDKLSSRTSAWLPESVRAPTMKVWTNLNKALFGYLRAQLVMISITAIFVTVGLLILNVEYAISIGLFIGFVDLLPYLGTGAVMIPWIIYEFIQGDVPLGIGLSIVYGIVLVTRSLIEPKVLASSIGLDPLATLLFMVLGLNLFGAVGLIIGPVTLMLLLTFHRVHIFRTLKEYILYGPSPIKTE
ncbi:sporulation integral membrane protein YtvI [Marinicrinis sediminis]|uniref:Sporulation integral membrane protein YtvI n=1 Tax=Marinicrinis sediminis TaxID=1652465 RepID=A0ABW5R9I6_9BACL